MMIKRQKEELELNLDQISIDISLSDKKVAELMEKNGELEEQLDQMTQQNSEIVQKNEKMTNQIMENEI